MATYCHSSQNQIPSDSVRVQCLSKRPSSLATCIQSLLSKNAIERVENVKSLGFYSRLFLVPNPHQRWRPVRPKQAQHFSTRRKVQNGNSRVHQDLPHSRGMGIVDRSVGRLPAHPHPSKLTKIPKVLIQSLRCSSSPPSHSD